MIFKNRSQCIGVIVQFQWIVLHTQVGIKTDTIHKSRAAQHAGSCFYVPLMQPVLVKMISKMEV